MITLNERKIERRKNRMETARRLWAELQYMLGVMLAYVIIYLVFYSLFRIVCFFVTVIPFIRFSICIILFYISAKCTRVVAASKAFNRNVLNPKK